MTNLCLTFNEMYMQRNLEPASMTLPANDNGDSPTEMMDALEKMSLLAQSDRARTTLVDNGGSSAIYRVEPGEQPGCSRWSTSTRIATRAGQACSKKVTSIRQRRRRSDACSVASMRRRPTTLRSRSAFSYFLVLLREWHK